MSDPAVVDRYYVVQRGRGPIERDSFAAPDGRYTEEIRAAQEFATVEGAAYRALADGFEQCKLVEITVRSYQL